LEILTINLHSYLEENQVEKQNIFLDYLKENAPQVVGMQEINQPINSELYYFQDEGKIKDFGIELNEDNYGLKLFKEICDLNYYYTWLGIKESYGKFHEGIGFFTKTMPEETMYFNLSRTNDRKNWKKRMSLGVKINGVWYFNLHMGRWDDIEEPFKYQWESFLNAIPKNDKIIAMGDFNSPHNISNEGYSLVRETFCDVCDFLKEKKEYYTAKAHIDGWEDEHKQMRIDYVFSNFKCNVFSVDTVFDGINKSEISDHFALLVKGDFK